MINIKRTFFAFFLVLGLMQIYAQNEAVSLDGWQLGGRLEGDIVQPITADSYEHEYDFARALPTFGWAVGVEASYNFAKYFGVSAGLDFGTSSKYRFRFKGIEPKLRPFDFAYDFYIPINLNLHIPLKNNWFFNTSLGMRFSYIGGGIELLLWGDTYYLELYDHVNQTYAMVYLSKNHPYYISMGATMKVGFSYVLPRKDILRFGLVANFDIFNKYVGIYEVRPLSENFTDTILDRGRVCYRHNCYGLEFAYIHCFKQKKQK